MAQAKPRGFVRKLSPIPATHCKCNNLRPHPFETNRVAGLPPVVAPFYNRGVDPVGNFPVSRSQSVCCRREVQGSTSSLRRTHFVPACVGFIRLFFLRNQPALWPPDTSVTQNGFVWNEKQDATPEKTGNVRAPMFLSDNGGLSVKTIRRIVSRGTTSSTMTLERERIVGVKMA